MIRLYNFDMDIDLLLQTGRTMDIRWKSADEHRAPRVPPAEWAEHKQKLFDLHKSRTLDEIMEVMRIDHNFTPS